MAKLSISLSRAHKIGERIKARMNELFTEAQGLGSNQNVAGFSGEAQIAKLVDQGNRAIIAFDRAEKFSEALSALRARIGAENQERGINSMLAHLEGMNRIVSNLKVLIDRNKSDGITPAELTTYKPLAEGRGFGGASVAVVVVTPAQVTVLEQRLAQVQREAFALSDRIAEANAARFELDLDDEIATEVTGV